MNIMSYEFVSPDELREQILNEKIDIDLMTAEDYRAVLFEESRYDQPDAKIINFCINGLFNIQKSDIPLPSENDYENLIQKYTARKSRKIKLSRFFMIAAIIVILSSIFVFEAAGLGIFKFIFRSDKENQHILVESNEMGSEMENENEEITETYNQYVDIPEKLKKYTLPSINDQYSFADALFHYDGNSSIFVSYIYEDKYIMTQFHEYNNNGEYETTLPKDDKIYERYEANNNEYTIMSNEESLTCYWQNSNSLFIMSINASLEETKNILDFLSQELPFFFNRSIR